MYKAIACVLLVLAGDTAAHAADSIAWQPWSEAAFADAKRERKFVLLDLQSVWCHWCHVMDQETYSDPKIIALVKAHYIAVRVDQDSRPDLSNRYEDYGWPATVVFAADHSEIVKRQGYLPPREMSSMLEAIIADPSSGPSVTGPPVSKYASSADAQDLKRTLVADYDKNLGGWGTVHKYLDWDNMEYPGESASWRHAGRSYGHANAGRRHEVNRSGLGRCGSVFHLRLGPSALRETDPDAS